MSDVMRKLNFKEGISNGYVREAATKMIDNRNDEVENELTKLELNGTNCPYCGIKPVIVEVNRTINESPVKFDYWRPACDCFTKKNDELKKIRDLREKLKTAGVPEGYWNYKFSYWDDEVNSVYTKHFEEIRKGCKTGKLFENYNGLVLRGDTGTGKTMLAVCVMKYAMVHFPVKNWKYIIMSELTKEIINKKMDNFIDIAKKYSCVVLDDIEKACTGGEWVQNQIFALLDSLVANDVFIISTSNLRNDEQFRDKFSQPVISRMMAKARIYTFLHAGNDDDYRYKLT